MSNYLHNSYRFSAANSARVDVAGQNHGQSTTYEQMLNHLMRTKKLRGINKFALKICVIALGSLSFTAFSSDRLDLTEPLPHGIVGLEMVNGKYPGKWVIKDSGNYEKNRQFQLITRYRTAVLVLAHDQSLTGRSRWKITKAVLLKGHQNVNTWYTLSSDCNQQSVLNEKVLKNTTFVAEVLFKKCSRYSTNILSAWLINNQDESLVSTSSKGMRCSNSLLDSGEFSECKFIPKEGK